MEHKLLDYPEVKKSSRFRKWGFTEELVEFQCMGKVRSS
jgi:hypothetical protein